MADGLRLGIKVTKNLDELDVFVNSLFFVRQERRAISRILIFLF